MCQISVIPLLRIFILFGLCIFGAGCVTETTKDGKPYVKDGNVNMDRALADYVTLAGSYLKQGDRENALRSINKGLAIDPKSPAMLNVLAFYYESDGESELAEKEFRKAISADKSYTASYMNYGVFLFSHQRYESACEMLSKASADVMYAGRADVFTNLGMCLKKLGKNSEAEEAFERSLKHDFRNPRALLEMSSVAFEKGEFIDSQKYYDEYLKYGQQTPRSLWIGIRLAHIADDKDKKSSYALFLKNQFPDSKEYGEYKSWSGAE